ncbi:MAG TPA: HAMP domain-containing sensor histidine kinase [Azospirillaceae bacterium]|nr:HAMP domain-containing sensor histidine kinase [Azospirillaceae bacterium]
MIPQRLIDSFVPAAVTAGGDPARLIRYRGFVAATLAMLAANLAIVAIAVVQAGGGPCMEAAHWGANAVMLMAALAATRLTGRVRPINLAAHLLSTLFLGSMLYFNGGLASEYLLPIAVAVGVSGSYGRSSTVAMTTASYLVMFAVLYGLHLAGRVAGDVPVAEVHVRFALTAVSLLLLLSGSLIAERARLGKSRLLRDALEQAEERRARAEEALAELARTREQVLAQERMASLGSMVAGITHDVSTPLGLVMTGAGELAAQTDAVRRGIAEGRLKKSELEAYLQQVQDLAAAIGFNGERAAGLIDSFKAVSVDQASSGRRSFGLADYIDDVVTSLAPTLKRHGHAVRVDCPAGIVVDGYPGCFAQVLTNLVMNSVVHAYPDGRAGTLSITVERMGEGAVRLTYADDGRGIPRELWGRVFDPFFTTRRGSGGSGVGLHMVHRIVTEAMGGTVELGEAAGGGARFTLAFPLSAPARDAAPAVLLAG